MSDDWTGGAAKTLPRDTGATLVGRVWDPEISSPSFGALVNRVRRSERTVSA